MDKFLYFDALIINIDEILFVQKRTRTATGVADRKLRLIDVGYEIAFTMKNGSLRTLNYELTQEEEMKSDFESIICRLKV